MPLLIPPCADILVIIMEEEPVLSVPFAGHLSKQTPLGWFISTALSHHLLKFSESIADIG